MATDPLTPPDKRRRRPLRWFLLLLATGVAAALLVGCRTIGYYAHVVHGHADLMARRQPIAGLLDDPATDPALRAKLELVLDAREFASEHLALPRNRSYTYYSELDRPFVLWNVFAAEEFSVEPIQHCFPIAGCVGYRGYFDRQRAEQEAARLQAQGLETFVGGVPAYSTLGWFGDPVLSSMPLGRRDQLIGMIFHELAHQKLYARGDTAFNESYAKFVQQQGLREWRQANELSPSGESADYRPVIERILALRERLARIYREPVDAGTMRTLKQQAIDAFRHDYRSWRQAEGVDRPGYDHWVELPIDNAKLVPFGLYDRWLPAFERLFAEVGGDWATFHRRAAELARLPFDRRQAELRSLLPDRPAVDAID